MDGSLERLSAAELLNTALLMSDGAGSVAAALAVGESGSSTPASGSSRAPRVGRRVGDHAFDSTSGANSSPAVTVVLAGTGRFYERDVPAHVVAQLAGSVVGAAMVIVNFRRRPCLVAVRGGLAWSQYAATCLSQYPARVIGFPLGGSAAALSNLAIARPRGEPDAAGTDAHGTKGRCGRLTRLASDHRPTGN